MNSFTITIPANITVTVTVTPDMLEYHSILEYAVYETALETLAANLPDSVSITTPNDFDVFTNVVKPA